MFRALGKGLLAGAAGTTALNAVTYADMAVRARPASELPEKAVELAAQRAGQDVPGDGPQRQHRLSGLGGLSGIATGLGVGVAAAFAGPVLRRLPLGLAALGIGGAAMAASDVPMAKVGLTDPGAWSREDWLADAGPHLAYGVVTAWAMRAVHQKAG
jgi:hypothetical protein